MNEQELLILIKQMIELEISMSNKGYPPYR